MESTIVESPASGVGVLAGGAGVLLVSSGIIRSWGVVGTWVSLFFGLLQGWSGPSILGEV